MLSTLAVVSLLGGLLTLACRPRQPGPASPRPHS
jgi:hypothetical protein